MDFPQKLDPELAAVLQAMPAEGMFNWDDLPATREVIARMLAQMMADVPDLENVLKEDHKVPGPTGDPEVLVRIYRPAESTGTLPGLLWIPGGGYVMGSIEQEDYAVQHVVEAVGCVVVSVEYRRAPEHPFPAPIEDCYAALKWVADNATDLSVDPSRLAVGGASAGGGLAAGLALLARDRGEVHLIFQLLVSPMIDDRNVTLSSREITDPRVWNREANLFGWRSYVGESIGSEGVSPYAAVARATDLAGLPPAYIPVGTQDLFVDEDMAYAQRLMQAGVLTELHVYPGAFHGSEGYAPAAALSRRFLATRNEVLRTALRPRF